MSTILFFDDLRLNPFDNVKRVVGRPRLVPESVFRDPTPDFITPWAYPSVFEAPGGGCGILRPGNSDMCVE